MSCFGADGIMGMHNIHTYTGKKYQSAHETLAYIITHPEHHQELVCI